MGIVRVGFTGTRKGMTTWQKSFFEGRIVSILSFAGLKEFEFHHGGCTGADADAHEIVCRLRAEGWAPEAKITIHVHPGDLAQFRAPCDGADVWYEEKPPLDRNKDIVNTVGRMIAAPGNHPSLIKSPGGTWHTIRYALQVQRPVTVVGPEKADGFLALWD